jgi:hypothetical protein
MARVRSSAILIAFSLVALQTGGAAGQCSCEELTFPHPSPPSIPRPWTWSQVGDWVGTGAQRIAVVVWDDLYDQIQDSIDTYADDVAAAGFTVGVFRFYGMVEDPDDPDAPDDLRAILLGLFQEDGRLAGVELVGNVPWIILEGSDEYNFASDYLIGDLNSSVTDTKWQEGAFDTWTGDQLCEVWDGGSRPGGV